MKNFYLLIFFLFLAGFAAAQWKPVPLNYKYTKRPDFFIPQSMHFSDSANGFILTSNALLRLKDFQWQPVNTGIPDSFSYTNMFTVDSANTFLCGWDGKVSKFNGDSVQVLFTLDPSETDNPLLNTIFMFDSTHGWAAGDGGTVVRIDGNNHSMQNQLPQYIFKDIYFDSPEHGWMIGYSIEEVENGGVIFEFTDGTWILHSTVPGQAFDIAFSSPGNGFITGQLDIYRYNAGTNQWMPENIPNYYRQYHLSMLNDNYGISVSDNYQNMLYQDGVWSPAPAAAVADLLDIRTTSNGNAWAISQTGTNNPQNLGEGKIQFLENNIWSSHSLYYLDTVKILPLDVAVTSITGLDKKNLWFDGQYLKLPSYTNWPDSTPVLNTDTFNVALKMFSNNFGIGLNGDLLEWNNGYWINKNIDPVLHPDTSISNVCMQVFNDTSGFICRQLFSWSSGEMKNVIAQYDYQTNSLTTAATLDTRYPYTIHFSDKQNGWVAGDSGLLVKYSENSWDILPTITDKRLNSIFTVSASAAWAAGDEGTLLRYSNGVWIKENLPTQQNLYSIFFIDSSNGWVVGDSGLIFYYNGTVWTQDTTNITSTLYSIFMIDSTYGFAGGENGTLLQFAKPLPQPEPAVQKFCEFANTFYTFLVDSSHYNYQWQVDSGNGFENLTESVIFSGTNDDTLWLANVPPDFYGYKFRCIASYQDVDSTSIVEVLKFVNRWTGEVSTAWEDAGNWSCGSLPGENTDVIITSGEIILSSEASIRSLTVLPGVNITLAENSTLNILK